MTAKAPRYLLREALVRKLLGAMAPGRFLEIGPGNGDFLLLLHELGFRGLAYDSSESARQLVSAKLSAGQISDIEIADHLPDAGTFDYVFFFELIGYLDDPAGFLAGLKARLHSGSRLIFSFTNVRHQGDAEKYSGDMACFSRQQIDGILRKAGYQAVTVFNYGYPLSNMLRPLLNRYYRKQHQSGRTVSVDDSGLVYTRSGFRLSQLLFNRLTLWPFFLLQSLFRHSDLGTGYVVVAVPLADSGTDQDANEQ